MMEASTSITSNSVQSITHEDEEKTVDSKSLNDGNGEEKNQDASSLQMQTKSSQRKTPKFLLQRYGLVSLLVVKGFALIIFALYVFGILYPSKRWMWSVKPFQQKDALLPNSLPGVNEITIPDEIQEEIAKWVRENSVETAESPVINPQNTKIIHSEFKHVATGDLQSYVVKEDLSYPYKSLIFKGDENTLFLGRIYESNDDEARVGTENELLHAENFYKNKSAAAVNKQTGLIFPVGTVDKPQTYISDSFALYPYTCTSKMIFSGMEANKLSSEAKEFLMRKMLLIVLKLHEQQLVHNDLDDKKFIVSENGEVSLVNFTEVASPGKMGRVSDKGYYQEPERFMQSEFLNAKEALSDPKTDLFSLGMIFHYMLTGKRTPLPGSDLPERQYMKEFKKLSEVTFHHESTDKVVVDLVDDLLQPRRNDRLSSKDIWNKYGKFIMGDLWAESMKIQ